MHQIVDLQDAKHSSLASNNKNQRPKASQSEAKLVKKYFNLEEILNDPIKTKHYIDKLNLQLIEKDSVIRDLSEKINPNNENNNVNADEAPLPSSASEQQQQQQ